MSKTTSKTAAAKGPCCKLAETLGAERTAELNAELRTSSHRSFRKLAVELGGDVNHTAVKRHKHKCLGLGERSEAVAQVRAAKVDTVDLPPVKVKRGRGQEAGGTPGTGGTAPEGVPGGGTGTAPVPAEDDPPRARARTQGSDKSAYLHEERVLQIVAKVADGSLVPLNLEQWAREWEVTETTVRRMVREAYLHARVDRGTIDERRVLAMGMWERQIELCDDALLGEDGYGAWLSAMDKALLLRERKGAIEGWCKAAGVFDDAAKLQVNIVGHPAFGGLVEAVLLALVDEPTARAKVQRALRARAEVLRQPVPAMLTPSSSEPVVIETTGESAA